MHNIRWIFIASLLLINKASLAASAPTTDPSLMGKTLYERCAACHLKDGQGVKGLFPPLKPHLSGMAIHKEGRDYLVMVISAGLMGPIVIEGKQYSGIMPAQGEALGPEGIALVLNFLLVNLNGMESTTDWQAFTAAEVENIQARYPNLTGYEIKDLREKMKGAKQ